MKRYLILVFCLVTTFSSAYAQLTEQEQIKKLNSVYQNIRNHYVDDVSLEPLVEEAIIATLKELDPHSCYLTREEMESTQNRLRGEFAGIGIRYYIHNDTLVVRSTIDGSPAQRADILSNDRITAINGQNVIGLATDSISSLLKGRIGSKVKLQILRRNSIEEINTTIKREIIKTNAISSSFRIGDVGYISFKSFSKPLSSEFYDAYKRLGDVKSLVIDLRDNGGGAISAAIDVTSLFLEKGDVIVSTEGNGEKRSYNKKSSTVLNTIPVVVIINENSASASEIFAGAIQDYDRGVIVGRTSYGKGLVQRIISLKDGSGICLTIARYKTPSGRIIQRPYSMGMGEEYLADSIRYMHPDSIRRDSMLIFKTLKNKRTVYGGGGITPDVYIGANNILISRCVAESQFNGVFEHVITDYWDIVSIDDVRQRYPTVEIFTQEYDVEQPLWDIYYAAAGYAHDGVTEQDKDYIRTMLMATMAEQLYDDGARHYVYVKLFDHTAIQAFAIADNPELMRSILE